MEPDIFRLLLAKYSEEVKNMKVDPVRQKALEPLLADLQKLLSHKPSEIPEIQIWTSKMRELITRITPLMTTPSSGKESPAPNSRALLIHSFLQKMKTFVAGELNQPNQKMGERRTGQELLVRLMRASEGLLDFNSSPIKTLSLEREVLRQLRLDTGSYAQRHHLTFAEPLWPSPPIAQDPNLVYFSGGEHVYSLLTSVCSERKLSIVSGTTGRNADLARWEQLRRSSLAVFDMTQDAKLSLASRCFELGIAQSLGRAIVILVLPERSLPFDIGIEPYVLKRDVADIETVQQAVDTTLYEIYRAEGESSILQTIQFVHERFGTSCPSFEVRHTLKLLQEANEDPIVIHQLLQSLLGFLESKHPQLLFPAWPGKYPQSGRTRCFHVMPFQPEWANTASNAVRKTCKALQAEYIRGDEVGNPRIIPAIWDEIAQASHVIVDLTGFNPNVTLELALALTLGRKTLIVGQGDTTDNLFPAIAKLRVCQYSINDDANSLKNITFKLH